MTSVENLPSIQDRFGDYHNEVGCYLENAMWIIQAVLEDPDDKSTPWFLMRKLLIELQAITDQQITITDTSKLTSG